MKRAIVIYLEDKRNLLLQFGCLYNSFKYVVDQDRIYNNNNNTDIVVFGSLNTLNKIPDDCIKVKYDAISYDPEWKDYHYINSISCLVGPHADFLDKYDMILRSDVDTFVTPAWNLYYPEIYSIGKGGYVNDQKTKDNLLRIAKKLNLNHKGIHNIGSTHYGYAKLVRQVCKLALTTTSYILNNEFGNESGQWPSWYKGVGSLYGSEIAVNHLVSNVNIDGEKLDYISTSEDSINNHPHIHCWHTDDMFSKFAFELGKYDNLTTNNIDKISKVKDYCLHMALKSKKEMPLLNAQTQLSLDTKHTRYKYLRHGVWGLSEFKEIKELVYDTQNNLYEISCNMPLSEDQRIFVMNKINRNFDGW